MRSILVDQFLPTLLADTSGIREEGDMENVTVGVAELVIAINQQLQEVAGSDE
jgi:hypothetical protein